MTVDWLCLGLGAVALVHYSCLCNFMPTTATVKIKVTTGLCVAASAGLVCAAQFSNTELALAALVAALVTHDLARWLDKIHICKMYEARKDEKE